jgi:hypothetical protein
MKVLLVTIAIGEKYLSEYYQLFHKSQKAYAEKYNYDFKVITDFLDKSYQHYSTISFNKILVCSQEWSANYDMIIFVDADILINPNAPPLHNYIDYGDCIGIADEYSQPSSERRINIQKRMGWETSATDYYKLAGFDLNTINVLNSGVLVMQPAKHAHFLKYIFHKYIQKSVANPRGFHYEQSCIGYELQMSNKFKIIDNKFNALWALMSLDNQENMDLQTYYNNNYFIHFAGRCDFHKISGLNQTQAA